MQTHGWICGPEKTGPPLGWLAIVMRAVSAPSVATSSLAPTSSPVTRPSKRPLGRTANAPVTSRPSSVTRMAAGSAPSMATSASPAEIRSARFETTSIFNAALALAGAIRSAVSAATSVLMASQNGTRAANLR